MITELTTEQKAAIPAHIEKWRKIALSTDPINFELAKESVIKLYELSGLQQPKQIIKMSLLPKSHTKSDVGGMINNLVCSVHNTINNKIINIILDLIQHAIGVEINWIRSISDLTEHKIKSRIYGGSIWSSYYAEYSFCRDVLNIKLPEIYNISEQLALNSTFSLFFRDTAYICDRPQSINIQIINDRGMLHNTSGPAIHWRDGSKYWLIEGIEVDEQIVMSPETQTIDQINMERNEERRRIRIEQYGWIKYLKESGAKLINSRINERDNQKEQLYQHRESNRFICVDPSTGRKYAIAVPHEITTCLEAQKYLSHGLDEFAIHRS